MSLIGNIHWFILGGYAVALMYFVSGLLLCCTIIGIPFGLQLFKIAGLAICPFGREVTLLSNQGCLSFVFNVIWLVFGWWEIALVHLVLAAIMALTIVGIPFAKAHWRLMLLSFLPFGSKA